VPFTLRNIKEDLEDIGPRFDGAADLEFRAATKPLELEKSALSHQRVPPGQSVPPAHAARTGVRPGYAVAPIALAIDTPCVLISEPSIARRRRAVSRQTLLAAGAVVKIRDSDRHRCQPLGCASLTLSAGMSAELRPRLARNRVAAVT
jgi:hypothetical protein